MSACRHPECHDPANCATCRAFATPWCDHQECRRPGAGPRAGGGPEAAPRGAGHAPEGMALLLKIAFGLGVVLMVWLVARASRGQEGEPWDPLGPVGPADFAPWSPAQ